MKTAYRKDIRRTIRREKKRFGSIMLITALGVTMLCGLRAACSDLRLSADTFYDENNLYDISVLSTLGLTDDDVAALADVEGIEAAQGAYSEEVSVSIDGQNKTATVKTLTDGMNEPYLAEGTLPAAADEIAVSGNYLTASGKSIGDTLTITEELEEDEDANFLCTEYTITASVIDPSDVDNHDGTMAFRSASTSEYTFFVTAQAVESDVYTAVYLTVEGADGLLCYGDAYKSLVDGVIDRIDTQLKDERQQARYDELTVDAYAELDDAQTEVNDAQSELDEKIADAQAEIDEAKETLADSREQLEAMAAFLPETEYAAQIAAIEQGEDELAENEAQLEEERADAQQEIDDAQAEIDDARAELDEIELPQWYIQDRSTLSGYTNVQSDSDCIEAVGTAFPILFLVVAILISLTTITRMVEEERGLIGTYKALGFTDNEIRTKYVLYAALACLLGGILGDLCGFVVLPAIIFSIFSVMYQFPWYLYGFDLLYGLGGLALFAVGIVGATWIACDAELLHTPASLMRPKAPKSGSRIFMERMTFLWKRMSFLNKVTARNLFRYKKRMLMTVGGIMGCTALVLCGFVVKDSVMALSTNQYEHVYCFDIMAATSDAAYEDFLEELGQKSEVADYISLRVDSVKVINGGDEQSVQLYVVPDGTDISDYICLEDENGEPVEIGSDSVYITQNAANVLGFGAGDEVALRNTQLVQGNVQVSALVRNYMGNIVYLSQSVYEELFGAYEPNGVLLHVSEACTDEVALKEELEEIDGVQSTLSIAETQDNFSVSVMIINVVVYIIIIMAAGLALVVLFTLATTNISERERELATIKVLGFYDSEVHLYVNKETLILTAFGIVLGLPLGNVLGSALTEVLNLPSIYFAVTIHPVSYCYAALLSFGFALLVDLLTNRTLNRIDPVEALKSVE